MIETGRLLVIETGPRVLTRGGPTVEVLGFLGSTLGLTVAQIGFAPLCATAVGLTWTRDPFDRLLAAHSIAAGLPLLTKDRSLLENLDLAFWD